MAANSPQSEPVAWTPPSYYAHINPVTGETRLVDSNGTPIASPPPFNRIINGGVQVTDPWGNDIPIYEPPTTGVHLYVGSDGIPRVVDEHGHELPSPPTVVRDQTGEWVIRAADGSAVSVTKYEAPTSDVYVHVGADGTPSVVNAEGNPIPSPPHVWRDGNDPTWRVMGTEGSIPLYQQPRAEMFVHTDASGTPSIVDSDGNPIPSPPIVWRDGADPTWWVTGSEGTIPPYVPPTSGFFIHESLDGSFQVVDERGHLIASPPQVWRDSSGDEFVLDGPGGGQLTVPRYQPPTSGIYIHESPDGTYQVVDANGNLVPSPPNVYRDHELGTYAVAGADGPGPQIPPLWPPAGEPPDTWPPIVDDEEPAPGTTTTEDAATELGDVPDDGAASDTTEAVPPGQPAVETGDAVRGPAPEGAEDAVEDVGALDARAEETERDTSAIGLEADELSALASADEVSATPIPLPEPPPPSIGEDLTEAVTQSEEELEGVPLPIPTPPGNEVSATPITLPDTAIPSGNEVSATPITLPDTASPEIEVLPIPVPEPVVEEPDWGDHSDVFDDVKVFEPTLVEEAADDELAD